jgi:hypothetical protein
MTRESIIARQEIDCNCNDCIHMCRQLDKYIEFDVMHTNNKGQVTSPSFRINYGWCNKFLKDVSFIPNTCQLDTQNCFVHRRTNQP